METHRTTLGENGRIVIPAAYRKALGIKKGDGLVLRLDDGEVRICSYQQSLRRTQEEFRRYVPDGELLSERLIAERRAEAERE